MIRKVFLATALAAALTTVPELASAHARLEKSDPPRRAALDTPPQSIRLWFNEALESEFSRVTLADEAGATIADAARVDEEDPKLLVLDVPGTLDAGKYTVTFEVLSVDGHRVKESFPFTVKDASRAEE